MCWIASRPGFAGGCVAHPAATTAMHAATMHPVASNRFPFIFPSVAWIAADEAARRSSRVGNRSKPSFELHRRANRSRALVSRRQPHLAARLPAHDPLDFGAVVGDVA